MLAIYEFIFGKDVTLTEEKIKEDCSGLQDFTHEALQPFCRETIAWPISNPQQEEAKIKEAKKIERMKLRENLQSPKPVKPFRLVNGSMSYKDVLMR